MIEPDDYERVQKQLYDDGDWTDEELEALAAEMFDLLDSAEAGSGPIG